MMAPCGRGALGEGMRHLVQKGDMLRLLERRRYILRRPGLKARGARKRAPGVCGRSAMAPETRNPKPEI